jgi:hypothetical protein
MQKAYLIKVCILISEKNFALVKFPHGTRSLSVRVANFLGLKRVVNNITGIFL